VAGIISRLNGRVQTGTSPATQVSGEWRSPEPAQVLWQHGRGVGALLGNQRTQSANDRFDDSLALLRLDTRKGGEDEVLEAAWVTMPHPTRPERLGENADVGGQVREKVSAFSLRQQGNERSKDRPHARTLDNFRCTPLRAASMTTARAAEGTGCSDPSDSRVSPGKSPMCKGDLTPCTPETSRTSLTIALAWR
jgi:hypothetical protein